MYTVNTMTGDHASEGSVKLWGLDVTIQHHTPQPPPLLAPYGGTTEEEAVDLAKARHEKRLNADPTSGDTISGDELGQMFERILKRR